MFSQRMYWPLTHKGGEMIISMNPKINATLDSSNDWEFIKKFKVLSVYASKNISEELKKDIPSKMKLKILRLLDKLNSTQGK